MNFGRGKRREEPEINFIPLIDLMLVILIFLMVTTTYNRFSELQITLPSAQANPEQTKPAEINLAIKRDGGFSIDGTPIADSKVEGLAQALRASLQNKKDPILIIHADAQTAHQNVVNAMEAARLANLAQIAFATQQAE